MSESIDLHTHSRYSDGTLAPAEVVRRAHTRGVRVLALTDHDSVSGCAEAEAEARALGMRLIGGVEINTCAGDHLHILGYGVDPNSTHLRAGLSEFRDRRRRRVLKIIDNLRRISLDICWEDVEANSMESLGRPHVADALVAKKIVRSRKEAFERFLMRGKPGYAEPMGPTPENAMKLIREAGGWPSLAHPGTLALDGGIGRWVDWGLEGIEVFYPTHSAGTIRNLLEAASEHRLLPTGGSDFHGPRTGRDNIGGVSVPPEHEARLLGRLGAAVP